MSSLFRTAGYMILLTVLILLSCTADKRETQSVRFALISNTSPESPFTGFTESLGRVFTAARARNPDLVIHTGNIIYGGESFSGIRKEDTERQYGVFFSLIKTFHCPVYTAAGDRDYFDGSLDAYSRLSSRAPYYSFNYGTVHFIVLNTIASGTYLIDTSQLKWLKNDLQSSSDSSAVIVITHHSLNLGKNYQRKKNPAEYLHKLFLKHRVKAVISGEGSRFRHDKKDSIEYINAGCGGYLKKKKHSVNQYYIAVFDQSGIRIEPYRISR